VKHRFYLVFRDPSGATAFEEEVTDLRALYEDLAFRSVCAGARANDGHWGVTGVEPAWRDATLAGVTVGIDGVTRRYGLAAFADQATELLVAHQVRQPGSHEQKEARPTWDGTIGIRHEAADEPPGRRRASVRRQPYPLIERERCRESFPVRNADAVRSSIFVASRLAADLCAESAGSLEEERADFLTGCVVRDRTGTASVVVLDRIAAETDTTRSLVHFGFSAQTFAAAQQALVARGTDQVIVGWHHSHPPPCGKACLMTIPACATDYVFFSVADRTVHRRGFWRPYMVALVSGKGANRRADDPIVRAYGWRNALIRERTFTVF
jgi:hypothetical protein